MSSGKMYYIHNGTEQSGPFSIGELRSQNISLITPVWFDGLNDWSSVGEIADLKSALFAEKASTKVENNSIKGSEISSRDKVTEDSVPKTPLKNWLVLFWSISILFLSFWVFWLFRNGFLIMYNNTGSLCFILPCCGGYLHSFWFWNTIIGVTLMLLKFIKAKKWLNIERASFLCFYISFFILMYACLGLGGVLLSILLLIVIVSRIIYESRTK